MSFGKSRNGSVPCRELLRMSGIAIVVSFSAVLAQAQAQPLEALLSQAHQTYADGVIGLQDVVFAQIPDFHPLRADLYVPTRSRGADPVVIWVHGGGWGVGGPREGDGGPYGSWPQVLSLDESPGAAERDSKERNLQVGHAIHLGVIPWAYDQKDADDQLEQVRSQAERQHRDAQFLSGHPAVHSHGGHPADHGHDDGDHTETGRRDERHQGDEEAVGQAHERGARLCPPHGPSRSGHSPRTLGPEVRCVSLLNLR